MSDYTTSPELHRARDALSEITGLLMDEPLRERLLDKLHEATGNRESTAVF
jgi:hypothetical protein